MAFFDCSNRSFCNVESDTPPPPKIVAFPWVHVVTSTGPGGFMVCVFINMTGAPDGSTESGFMEKPGIESETPRLQGIDLSPTPRWLPKIKIVAFPWLVTSTGLGGFMICVFII